MGWTSIYQLFWGSLGTGVLTHPQVCKISCTIPPKHNFSLPQTTCQGPRAKRLAKSSPTKKPQEPWGTTRHNCTNLNSLVVDFRHCEKLQHGSKQPCLMLVGVEPFTFFSFFECFYRCWPSFSHGRNLIFKQLGCSVPPCLGVPTGILSGVSFRAGAPRVGMQEFTASARPERSFVQLILYQLICWYLSNIVITIFDGPCIQQVPMAVKVQGWCWKQSSTTGEFYSHAFSDLKMSSPKLEGLNGHQNSRRGLLSIQSFLKHWRW